MRLLVCFALAGALSFVLACDEDEGPLNNGSEDFSLTITVLDSDGAPVPHLRVSSWNHLDGVDYAVSIAAGVGKNPADPMATTTICLALTENCSYDFTIRDLEDSLISSFDGIGEPGVISIEWSPQNLHSGAYKYTLEAHTTEPFTDTKYAYLHLFDADIDTIGHTNADGVFETRNRRFFPNTYNLPPQVKTSVSPDSLGTFQILDTVHFVLKDTSAGNNFMSFDSVVVNGENTFDITWNPTESAPARGIIDDGRGTKEDWSWTPALDGQAAAGDLNLDSSAFEQEDAELYIDYFCFGLSVFTINLSEQVAASDANQDGLPLTAADCAYLIRVMLGDSLPAPTDVIEVYYTYDTTSGEFSIVSDVNIGIAIIVVEGDVTPQLLAASMEMCYNYNGEDNTTRVVIYSYEGESFTGTFLRVSNDLVYLEMATPDGNLTLPKRIPTENKLYQNYPNPFN
jgi:hypothetical protein